MKQIPIILLLMCSSVAALAQKHHILADGALPLASAFPGFSVTYNYKLGNYFGVGLGAQGYRFPATRYVEKKFIPAVYADMLLYIRPLKKNQFLAFLDIGLNFYKPDNKFTGGAAYFVIPHNNGIYTGTGFGYFRKVTKRGWGPYIALKVLLNWYTEYGYDMFTQKQRTKNVAADGTPALSIGFRF